MVVSQLVVMLIFLVEQAEVEVSDEAGLVVHVVSVVRRVPIFIFAKKQVLAHLVFHIVWIVAELC